MFYKTSDLASGVLFKTTVRDSIILWTGKLHLHLHLQKYLKTLDHLMHFGAILLRGTMASLDHFLQTSEAIETQLMKKFITSQSKQATQRVESTTYSARLYLHDSEGTIHALHAYPQVFSSNQTISLRALIQTEPSLYFSLHAR